MAQLSKELATICTNSPIEFEQEKFQLGNIFTKEAYELCRKLDFRNFLMKFDPAEVNENTMEQDFSSAMIWRAVRHFLKKRDRQKLWE